MTLLQITTPCSVCLAIHPDYNPPNKLIYSSYPCLILSGCLLICLLIDLASYLLTRLFLLWLVRACPQSNIPVRMKGISLSSRYTASTLAFLCSACISAVGTLLDPRNKERPFADTPGPSWRWHFRRSHFVCVELLYSPAWPDTDCINYSRWLETVVAAAEKKRQLVCKGVEYKIPMICPQDGVFSLPNTLPCLPSGEQPSIYTMTL